MNETNGQRVGYRIYILNVTLQVRKVMELGEQAAFDARQ